jgi:hypothetical protein
MRTQNQSEFSQRIQGGTERTWVHGNPQALRLVNVVGQQSLLKLDNKFENTFEYGQNFYIFSVTKSSCEVTMCDAHVCHDGEREVIPCLHLRFRHPIPLLVVVVAVEIVARVSAHGCNYATGPA